MTDSKKHLSSKFFVGLFCSLIILFGCSKKDKSDKNIVKINDAVLTKSELDSALDQSANRAKVREEYINDWIEKEVLFEEAKKSGITEQSQYLSAIEKSKKELASAMLINSALENVKFEIEDEEVLAYYNSNQEEFRIKENLYRYNSANFSTLEKAIQFREKVLSVGWNNSQLLNRNDPTINFTSAVLVTEHDLQPVTFLRIISNLLPREVSIAFESEPEKYSVVQLIEFYPKDSILPFEIAKEEVQDKLLILKKKEFVQNYIKKLISDHNIEVERY